MREKLNETRKKNVAIDLLMIFKDYKVFVCISIELFKYHNIMIEI